VRLSAAISALDVNGSQLSAQRPTGQFDPAVFGKGPARLPPSDMAIIMIYCHV